MATAKKTTKKSTTKKDLEAKIADLEAKLNKLAAAQDAKPAEAAPKPAEPEPKPEPKEAPKPAETKKPEGGGGPHAHDEKPADKAPPKPADKAPPKPADDASSVPLHERFREIPTGNWNTQKVAITGFTAASNRYFGSRALVAQTNVTPSNWNDQKTKITGYTAPGNKYFATRQRLAYHPEAKKFGTWINDAPVGEQTKSAPPPPQKSEPQVSAGSTSDGKSKQEKLEDYEKDYLARLEQKKIDDAKAAAEAAKAKAAAAATKAQSNRGSLPKGFGPEGAKANTGH